MQVMFSPLFSGHKIRNNPDLKALKAGDTMVLLTQKLNADATVASETAERVTIVSVEPHMGNTVEGIKVERAFDKVLTHDDFVDWVSYKQADGTQKQMLYGTYEQDDGTHSLSKGKKTVHIKNQDAGVYDERVATQKKTEIVQFQTVDAFIQAALKKQEALKAQLKEANFKFASLLEIYNGNPGAVAKKMVDFLWSQELAKEAEAKKVADEAPQSK